MRVAAKVGRSVEITTCCRVGVAVALSRQEVLPEGTVVFGHGSRRIDKKALDGKGGPPAMLESQLAHLRALLPKFHPMQ